MMAAAKKSWSRGHANDRGREILDGLIAAAPAGRVFAVGTLTAAINWLNRSRSFSNTRTGRLLQERTDVQQVRPGVWRVIR